MSVDRNGLSPEADGGRRLYVTVRAVPESLADVRRSFGTLATPPAMLEDARLLVSELVSNSIRHARIGPEDSVRVAVEWSGTRLRVTVHDRPRRSAIAPVVAGSIRPRPGATFGWGLFLVDRIASRWGTDDAGYWFELGGEGSPD